MKVVVISLKKAVERRERVTSIMAKKGIRFDFFDAIDGRIGLPEDLQHCPDDMHRIIFRSRPLSLGEKGCFASHYRLWQQCVELNQPILILEDDFYPTDSFDSALSQIDETFKELEYLKIETFITPFCKLQKPTNTLQLSLLLDNSKGATGYALSPSGAKKLLAHAERWTCAVDNYISYSYIHGVTNFGLTEPAIFAPHDLGTYIQLGENTKKTPLYFKLTRELHRFYRFVRLSAYNRKLKRMLPIE
ncbi:glycosyltransferase family 25 protein [Vibrio cionasavignyae]|uniref:glycosyltransferase family 25 protein n=1 Tax=Vibrio cionasavignyae TaxID=2910252 RepID=UPI003D0C663D